MGSTNELILIGLFAAPLVVLLLLRVNAAMAFLSLCLGYVVMQFTSTDVRAFAETFVPQATTSANMMRLGLLLAPFVLTTLFMVHTMKGTKAMLNILPAAGVGCLLALLVVPLLAPGTSQGITELSLWQQFTRLQSLIVGAAALISLFFLWAQRPHHEKEKKSEKHH